jgi:hypothetical protein
MTAAEQLAEPPAAAVCLAGGCQQPPTPGSTLCGRHVNDLGQWLAQLGDEYGRLSAVPSMQGREVGTIGGATLAAQRSPGRLDVIALRSRYRGTGRIGWEDADAWGLDDTPSVYSTLATYAEQVREARRLTLPRMDVAFVRTARPAGPVCDPDRPRCGHHTCEVWTFRANVHAPLSVASERKLLATHLQWIVGQEWAGEFFDDIADLWQRLRSANGPRAADAPTGLRRLHEPCAGCGVRAVTDGPEGMLCQNCGRVPGQREKISA